VADVVAAGDVGERFVSVIKIEHLALVPHHRLFPVRSKGDAGRAWSQGIVKRPLPIGVRGCGTRCDCHAV
jgi:hypothetical protein